MPKNSVADECWFHAAPGDTLVGDVMSAPVVTVRRTATLSEALERFLLSGLRGVWDLVETEDQVVRAWCHTPADFLRQAKKVRRKSHLDAPHSKGVIEPGADTD